MLKRISISIFLGANLCTILLLWLCVALTYISPDYLPRLSLLTLAFPVFLLVDIAFIFFWLLFKARLAWVPILGLLLVGAHALDYCPMNIGKDKVIGESNDSSITVLTFNVGYMSGEEEREELIRFINITNADIVCLQELSSHFLSSHQEWLDSTDYHYVQNKGAVILSRHPFLSDTISIIYPTRSNHSTACWIDCYGDSLLVVNNHLESTHLSTEDKDDYANAITDPHRQTIKNSSRMLLGKLSEAASYRGAQTDSICSLIDRNPGHPVIVCGDHNDTPISYTYQRLARRLASAYREAGFGPGFTFSQRFFPVRIDHIFYSKDWQCLSCQIDKSVPFSDHYPVIARIGKKAH